MRRVLSPFLRFVKRDDGPTAVEYALVLALIIVVCVAAMTALGSGVTKPFKKYSKTAAVGTVPMIHGDVVFAASAVHAC